MKKVRFLERFSILSVLILVFLTSYCVVYGSTTITTTSPPTAVNPICLLAPKFSIPNIETSIPVVNEIYFEIYAPCSIGAQVNIVNLNGPQPSISILDGVTGTDSIIRTQRLPITTFYNGRYAVKATVGYQSTTGTPNNRYIGTDTQKFFDIKTGIPTTTTPIVTAPIATSPTTVTPLVETTQNTSTTNTITVDGKVISGNELQKYTSEKLIEAEQIILPKELVNAPISTTVNIEKAEVTMNNSNEFGKVILSGKAEPNTELTLYIFSEPIVVSVKSDANGDWSYTLDQDLTTGKHEVYVAVKKSDGTVAAKSQPFSFFVGTAQAAAVNDDTTNTTPNQRNYLIYYITLAVAFVAIMVAIVFFLVTRNHLKKHNETTQV